MRLSAFEGEWIIERVIEDVRAGRSGRLDGIARFEPIAGGLAYAEEGQLRMGDAPPLTATRRYTWHDAGAGTIEVRFSDGRLFHRFYADEPAPRAVHDCPPDQYRARYDFARWPRWTAEWRVRGPRKDYAIVTRYRPAHPSA